MAYIVGTILAIIISYFFGEKGVSVALMIVGLIPFVLFGLFFYYFVLPSQFWANL